MRPTSNKNIITGFYRHVIRERKSELIPLYVHENYIQHSATGKDGRQALFEMVEFLKTLPPPAETEKSPIIRLIEQHDLVVVHLELHFMGKDIRVIEMFRVQDGKAAEHWDVTEELNSDTKSIIEVQPGAINNEKRIYLTELYDAHDIKIHRMISEENFTAVHAEAKSEKGSIALFDNYQFERGILSRHWAAKQQVPEKMMHNNGMF